MRSQDLSDLVILAAIWGSSFLFIRIAVTDFGPFALMAIRSGLALLVLIPLLFWRHRLPVLIKFWKPIFTVGIFNAAIPFSLLAYAALTLPAGVLSVMNAATPLWGGLITWLWLKDKLPFLRILGLVIGFSGILLLVWDELDMDAMLQSGLALAAGLLAPVSYGFSASYTKRHLMGASASAVACGCLVSATIILMPLAWLTWPDTPISTTAWSGVLMLGLLCTGMSHILFYRLVLNAGPAKASTVTLMIPVFGVLWGWMWLGEDVGLEIMAGCLIILVGTAFATGIVGERGVWGRSWFKAKLQAVIPKTQPRSRRSSDAKGLPSANLRQGASTADSTTDQSESSDDLMRDKPGPG
ncbi:DMT family transporter [Orrella marina]|uniref:EamA family transporter n=1 Tax=Orrella marina TaxID=2163011 RepID=A0A2R4XFQ9_9BURK|nr:DMT family transporter [Orrella marina]AWB32636.1 EamA family transporter [Orrella marina]